MPKSIDLKEVTGQQAEGPTNQKQDYQSNEPKFILLRNIPAEFHCSYVTFTYFVCNLRYSEVISASRYGGFSIWRFVEHPPLKDSSA